MASLLRRAISLSSPNPRFLQSRYASSAASLSSSPHVQNKSEQIQKSADSAHNTCIHVPCPTRKLESSSFPSSIRTDSINISKAVDSAFQHLQQESEEDNLIEAGDLSLEISERGVFVHTPDESIYYYNDLEGRYYRYYICVDIVREDGCIFEYGDRNVNDLSYEGTWKSWQNYLQCSKDIKSESWEKLRRLMIERLERRIERILAKRGINTPIWKYVFDRIRRAEKLAKKLTWMQNVKNFMHN